MTTIEQDGHDCEEQVGGARVRILDKSVHKSSGRFRGMEETVALSLDLSNTITTDPRGPELFADTLIELVHRHDPFKTPQTKAGLTFGSPEISESVGLVFKEIRKITSEEIIENMEKMSQSRKSLLELDVPKISVQITYLNPPSGSGKRKFDTGRILELTAFEKKRKVEDDETGEAEIETAGPRGTRSNIMPNEVLEDCLPHALYQSLMYYEWKQCKSIERKNKYRSSIRKTFKRPAICPDVYEAVNDMKEKCGLSKFSNFDRLDVEKFQKNIFAGSHQIVVFAKNSSTPYYVGLYVGKGKQLALYLADGHYRRKRSVCALLKTDYYYFLCNTRYKDATSHYKCPLIHRLCGQKNCPTTNADVQTRCKTCTITFRSQICYDNHLKKGPKNGRCRCEYTKACRKSEKVYYTNKNKDDHKCGEKWCYRCNCKKIEPHKCIMPKSLLDIFCQ